MLSRALKIWLIVSILGYGMALAADVHGELTADGVHLSANSADHPLSGDSADDSDCNHCAHGSSHLLGLNSTSGIPAMGSRGVSLSGYLLSWYSFSPPSLLRPPIAG
ncbi:hypothetical protein [Thiolapillus sp.]